MESLDKKIDFVGTYNEIDVRIAIQRFLKELKTKTAFDYTLCNSYVGRFGNRELEIKMQNWFIENINNIALKYFGKLIK